ncbi:hypothetical protein [Oceanisphaera ostreae]|uniref:Uncharacterized protein n=1 Tax=Oceanisphaera ostreae TaxID=914151 RepID=A0ABW3KMY4_9GAMM
MAAHIPPDGKVNNNNPRYLHLYQHYLSEAFNIINNTPISNDVDYLESQINNALINNIPSLDERIKFINNMHAECSGQYVADGYLSWLDDNIACTWLWLIIISDGIKNSDLLQLLESCEFNTNHITLKSYNELNLDLGFTPSNHKERLYVIQQYLDRFCLDIYAKLEIIKIMNNVWDNSENLTPIVKWLKKEDETQCEWVWNYFNKEVIEKGALAAFKNITKGVVSPQEKYIMFFGFYVFWLDTDSSKKLFFLQMKNSWAQKKSRLNKVKKNLRGINVSVAPEVGKQLEELAVSYSSTITKVIELAIRNEYKKFKNK